MKKVIIIVWVMVLGISAIYAENNEKNSNKPGTESAMAVTLKGSVQDMVSGEMLAGVEIKLEGTDLKTYTDLDGNFSFSSVKPGEYKVITNYISYTKKIETVSVSKSIDELKLKLQTSK